MSLFESFLFSFVSTLGWSVYFNAPKKDLLYCSLAGAIGWITCILIEDYTTNTILSNFIATFIITLFSEFLARRLKKPAILYIIPGIIPLVPGLSIYNTMLDLIQGNYLQALERATNVAMISGAIVMGMLIVTSVLKGLKKIQHLKDINNLKNIKKDNK